MDLEKLKKDQKSFQENSGSSESSEYAVTKTINTGSNIIRFPDPDKYEICYRSWVLCDDGKKRPFVLEDAEGNKSLLLQMLGDRTSYYKGGILESVKDEHTGKKKYVYEDQYPDILLKIAYNGDKLRPSSWSPTKHALFNIIDRDPDRDEKGNIFYWCKDNKHMKLLWVKPKAFTSYVNVIDNDGDPSSYDINYQKTGTGKDTVHNMLRAGNALPNVAIGELTEEEKTYGRYDLKQEARLSAAGYVLFYLKETIKEIDSILGTNYLLEFEKQAEIEKQEWETANNIESSQGNTDPFASSSNRTDSSVLEQSRSVVGNQDTIHVQQNNDYIETPNIQIESTFPTQRRASIEPPKEQLICQNCNGVVTEEDINCPHCKVVLQAACDNVNCKQYFSVYSFKCPHCGQEYGKA